MKKAISLIVMIALSSVLIAQINLEHTFTSAKDHIHWFVSNTNGIMFYRQTGDTIANELEIYNEDCSLYKKILFNRPAGYTLRVLNVSEQLFDTNTSLEFLCLYVKNSTDCKMTIYDENKLLIKDFGDFNFCPEIDIVSNGNSSKLIIEDYSSDDKVDIVYSLPGKQLNSIQNVSSAKSQPYPNPSSNIINLPYTIKNSEISTMKIFDNNGRLVTQKRISSLFDKIQLNVDTFNPGIYFYEYEGVSRKFIVK